LPFFLDCFEVGLVVYLRVKQVGFRLDSQVFLDSFHDVFWGGDEAGFWLRFSVIFGVNLVMFSTAFSWIL